MNKFAKYAAFIFLVAACDSNDPQPHHSVPVSLDDAFYYEVGFDFSKDQFKVTLYVDNLSEANAAFQFAATVPGTYDIFNMGVYVTSFKAYSEDGKELHVTHNSINQWTISDPELAHKIEYKIKETWDTPVTEHAIYRMAGTSIEDDHVLLNSFCVLGYPTGLKERDIYLKVNHPKKWGTGTALPQTEDGLYHATNYDTFVDSPILMGKITSTTQTIDGTEVSIITYSKNNTISASMVTNDINQVLLDAKAFLKTLPVDRYSFLWHFGEYNSGALEHSYSSVYVLKEDYPSSARKSMAAHEFFHIVTPLNIHSEIIEDFNFATPTPSQHLWLYEGVTEWASHTMQLRNNSISLTTWLNTFRNKIITNTYYDPDFSLTDIGLECYTPKGTEEYGNIYARGAVVAALLDIKLLELSNGESGLRELILELIDTYGKDNEFSEDDFFDTLVAMTYPEIEGFIDSYIRGTETLPIQEYFAKIGISFDPSPALTFTVNDSPTATAEQITLREKWLQNL